jgi:hypothetical protein
MITFDQQMSGLHGLALCDQFDADLAKWRAQPTPKRYIRPRDVKASELTFVSPWRQMVQPSQRTPRSG